MKKLIGLLIITTILLAWTTPITAMASTINTQDYVSYDYIDTGKQVAVTIKNTSNFDISLTACVNYYDATGKQIPTYAKDITTFEPGKTAIIAFDNPVGYKNFKVEMFVSLDYYLRGIGASNNVTSSSLLLWNGNYIHSVKNNSSQTVNIKYSVVYYKNNTIIKVVEKTASELPSFNTSFSWDDKITGYDNFKININEAYYY